MVRKVYPSYTTKTRRKGDNRKRGGVAQRVARDNGRIGGERDNDTGSMGVEEVGKVDDTV